jgi:hypothetical protein
MWRSPGATTTNAISIQTRAWRANQISSRAESLFFSVTDPVTPPARVGRLPPHLDSAFNTLKARKVQICALRISGIDRAQ